MTTSIVTLPSHQTPRDPLGDLSVKREGYWLKTYKTHKFALNFLALLVSVAIAASVEANFSMLLFKYCVLNGITVFSRYYEVFYPSIKDGVHLGYLIRGVHNLALAALGQWTSLISGLAFTLLSLNIIHYS